MSGARLCDGRCSSDTSVDFNLTGLSRGGQQIQKCRDTYVKAVGTLVELASLQVGSVSRLSLETLSIRLLLYRLESD